MFRPTSLLHELFWFRSHEKWLSGYTHHTCGRRPEVRIPGVSSSALPMSALAMASLLCSPHLWQGGLRHELQLSISCVLSPPASYLGLACQDRYIALRWINFESYDNLRKKKISSNFFFVLVPGSKHPVDPKVKQTLK